MSHLRVAAGETPAYHVRPDFFAFSRIVALEVGQTDFSSSGENTEGLSVFEKKKHSCPNWKIGKMEFGGHRGPAVVFP